jgi:DNA-binding GntR family transcriptional regulator
VSTFRTAPPKPDTGLTSTLGQSSYERMRDMILQGTLATGMSLGEKRLADILGVSRTPVREAITRLVSEGLVVHEAGQTPVVRSLSIGDFIEVLHMRRLLEVEAAGRAAEAGSTRELDTLRLSFIAFRDGPPPDLETHMHADDSLHNCLADRAGSRLLAKMIQDLRLKTRIFDTNRLPARLVPGAIEHIEIIDAVIARNPERAQAAMRAHIENVRASVLSHLGRLF